MPVSAIVEDNEAEFEEADPHVTLALCDLLEEAGAGRLTLIELARRLGELTAAAPEHIDARAHLGSVLMKCERLQEAAAEYNPYIAEILCGNPSPMPLRIWEGTNWQGAETAREYVGEYGELWRWTADALEFLRWLHTHPRVMAERAAVIECRQELLWENDFHAGGAPCSVAVRGVAAGVVVGAARSR